MNANLSAYYWAEQANRQGLSNRAARGWLAEEAAARRRAANRAAQVRWAAGGLLVRVGARLQGAGTVPPLAAPDGTLSRA